MDKPVVSDIRFIDALKESIIEISGESNASQILAAEPGIQTAGEFIQVLGDDFTKSYGIQSARGLLIRVGRSAAGYLWRNHHAISILGTIEKRLSPIHHRFEPAVIALLSVISPEIGMEIAVKQSSENEFIISLKNHMPQKNHGLEYVLFLLKGLLEAVGNWLDSRKDYGVSILDENDIQNGRIIKISIKAAQ